MVLAAINMVLLALALSAVNPRIGSSYHLGLALFVFVAYYNFINVGQSWISTGRVGAVPFVISLHGGVMAVAILWLSLRHTNWSWRHLLPVKTPWVDAQP
jgi:lipopolysaccharide export system permease protein